MVWWSDRLGVGVFAFWFHIDGTLLALHRLGNTRGDDERDLEAF